MLNIVTAQTTLENLLRDTILLALGKRLPAVANVVALRAIVTQGASSTIRTNDDLINIVVAGIVTSSYRWSTESNLVDNGTSIIKPTDTVLNGRWLQWTSPIRFVPIVGGNSFYLHELLGGPLKKVIILDRAFSEDEFNNLLLGQFPSVLIETNNDNPQDYQQDTGWRYDTTYEFNISVISENLRDRREAAQGSPFSIDSNDPGANIIDGFIKSLLGGVNLYPALNELRNTQLGRGNNYLSSLGQRHVMRERTYRLLVTEENPPAPNDAGIEQDVTIQPELIDLHDQSLWDENNHVNSGILVTVAPGLTQMVSIGTAIISGTLVTYAGESHAFPAYSDIYRDLLPNGALTFIAVTAEGSPPPITPTALRVGVSNTDGSGVISDRYIAITEQDFTSQYDIPL